MMSWKTAVMLIGGIIATLFMAQVGGPLVLGAGGGGGVQTVAEIPNTTLPFIVVDSNTLTTDAELNATWSFKGTSDLPDCKIEVFTAGHSQIIYTYDIPANLKIRGNLKVNKNTVKNLKENYPSPYYIVQIECFQLGFPNNYTACTKDGKVTYPCVHSQAEDLVIIYVDEVNPAASDYINRQTLTWKKEVAKGYNWRNKTLGEPV